MKSKLFRTALVALFAVAGRAAQAQQQAVAVQLPTFSFFTVDTSVVVPDSGAGIRAAMAREAAQRSQQPLWRAREESAPGAAARFALPAQPRPKSFSERLAAAQQSSAGQSARSVAAIRAARLDQDEQRQRESEEWLGKAAEAEAAGKPGVAKLYRRKAQRLATDAQSRRAGRVANTRTPE